MSGTISVIIPVYKVEPYLARCMDSVLGQTYENLEVILVDDGSPDNCPALCDAYAERDARVKVIHQANSGVSAARNAGLDAATGDYIGFVDSDDAIHSRMYEILHRACTQENAEIALCPFAEFAEKERPRETHEESRESEILTPRQAIARLYGPQSGLYTVLWNKLYRRTVFQTIRFPVGKVNEDLYMACQVFDASNRIACTDNVLYYYFKGDDTSITRMPQYPGNTDIFDALEACRDYCNRKGYDELLQLLPSMYLQQYLDRCRSTRRGDSQSRELFRMFAGRFREEYRHHPKELWELRFCIFNRLPKTYFMLEDARNWWVAFQQRSHKAE